MDAVLQLMVDLRFAIQLLFHSRQSYGCTRRNHDCLGCIATWVFLVTRAIRAIKGVFNHG